MTSVVALARSVGSTVGSYGWHGAAENGVAACRPRRMQRFSKAVFLALVVAGFGSACGSTRSVGNEEPGEMGEDTSGRELLPSGAHAAPDRIEVSNDRGDRGRQDGDELMHRSSVKAAAASGDGGMLVTGAHGEEVVVWRTSPLAPRARLAPSGRHRSGVVALAVSPSGDEIAVATRSARDIERWDARTFEERAPLSTHTIETTALAYGPQGLLATAGVDRDESAQTQDGGELDDEVPPMQAPTVRLWRDGQLTRELVGPAGRIRAIQFDGSGRRLAAATDGKAFVWDLESAEVVAKQELDGDGATVAFIGDEVCAVSSREAICFAGDRRRRIAEIRGFGRVAWIDDEFLISSSYDEIEVRNATDGSQKDSAPGRAYAMVKVGAEIWVVLSDRILVVRRGTIASESLRLQAPPG